jgi:serine/threonine-protein kinase
MSPEQARARLDTLDERADVFGLGAILCEILTGLPPYSDPSGDEVYRKATRADLSDALARLDASDAEPELIGLARACLAPAPKDRPRNAGVVAASLATYLAGVQDRLKTAELARARAESRAVGERKRRLLVAGLAASLLILATFLGGGALWWSRHVAALELQATRDVQAALHEASLLLGRARAADEADLAPWAETARAARHAQSLLARPEVGPDQRLQIQDLAATVNLERRQAEARSRDRHMLQTLATIHADIDRDLDFARADREHAAAFRAYGIDVDRLAPADAGARVAGSPIADTLVDALDQWAFIRRTQKSPTARQLSQVARAADPDPWRTCLRDALDLEASDPETARDRFVALASSAPHDPRHVESISRLAYALTHNGLVPRAIALLERIQRAHPDDFWINHDLARSFLQDGQNNQAIRFYSAALSLRPRSDLARTGLGKALRAAGRTAEADAYPPVPIPDPDPPKLDHAP